MKPPDNYYIVEPEVAGGLGDETELDSSVHPPRVYKLHYEFDGWLGDVLLETFPCFIMTDAAKQEIEANRLTGTRFDDVKVTTSEVFAELYPSRMLPKFVWLRIDGTKEKDDFGVMPDGRLVVSQRALDILRQFGIPNANVIKA